MAKPIFIIYYPQEIEGQDLWELKTDIGKSLSDYHIIFIPTETDFKFECYNGDEADRIKVEEFIKTLKKK